MAIIRVAWWLVACLMVVLLLADIIGGDGRVSAWVALCWVFAAALATAFPEQRR